MTTNSDEYLRGRNDGWNAGFHAGLVESASNRTPPPRSVEGEAVAWRYRVSPDNGRWHFSETESLLGLYEPLYLRPTPAAVEEDTLDSRSFKLGFERGWNVGLVESAKRADASKLVRIETESLPPGYKLGCQQEGAYWPLFNHEYISDAWYATKVEAELAAWKHAHKKLASTFEFVSKQLAPVLNATASKGDN